MKGKEQAGFSLVELIVGIALMMMVMASVSGVFTHFVMRGVRSADLNDRQDESRWVVSMISRDIRNAISYKVTTSPTSPTSLQLTVPNSIGGTVSVTYNASAAGLLQRTMLDPSTGDVAVSLLGNANHGTAGNNDFTINTSLSDKGKVAQVDVFYRVKQNAADNVGATTRATIYPLNDLTPQ